jgi:cytochrome c-type biogenesis protein
MLLAGVAPLAAGLAARLSAMVEHPLQPVTAFASRMPVRGADGQFALGAVPGLAGAPCTGLALGNAVALSAQAATAPQAAVTMLAFALGAATPLRVLGLRRAALYHGGGSAPPRQST